jgi:hypothetical protein
MSNFSSAARLRLNIHAWALLVLVIIEVLTNFLSDNLTVGQLTPNEQLMPHRLLYDLWLGVIILGLLAAVILWTLNNSRRLRVAIFLLNGVFTVQLLVATVLIVVRLAHSDKVTVTPPPPPPDRSFIAAWRSSKSSSTRLACRTLKSARCFAVSSTAVTS